MGGTVPFDGWGMGSNPKIKKQLAEVFSYYPKDWAKMAYSNKKQILVNVTDDRGFFSDIYRSPNNNVVSPQNAYTSIEDYITITSRLNKSSTLYHEVGHFVDFFNKDLVRIEKDFIQNRTKYDKEESLNSIFNDYRFDESERAKKDKFISPYIGKYYDDSTEVLSMGLQCLYTGERQVYRVRNGQKIYRTINDDIEYLNLIIGLIIKG